MNPWDQRYNNQEYFYGERPNTFLIEQRTALAPNSKILCLGEGEGEGRNAVYLATLGHEITAIDQSQVGLDKLKRLANKHQVEVKTICQDLATFSFPENTYDAIISIWCHLPSKLRKEIHQKSYLALKEKGVFILEAYTPAQLQYKTGGPSDLDLLMNLADLQKELRNLSLIHALETTRFIEEGQGHKGMSAVVQIVAKKIPCG